MYLKIIIIIASIGMLTAYPQTAKSQIKSLSELKIVKELLSEEESAQYRSGRKSPSGAYRMERGKTGYTVIDNNTNYIHVPDVPGKVGKISWPESEDRIAFDVSMIPILRSGFVERPFSTPILTSSPTPSKSIVWKTSG